MKNKEDNTVASLFGTTNEALRGAFAQAKETGVTQSLFQTGSDQWTWKDHEEGHESMPGFRTCVAFKPSKRLEGDEPCTQ